MMLVRNSRLSVQPVTPEEWAIVCELGGLAGKAGDAVVKAKSTAPGKTASAKPKAAQPARKHGKDAA
jgi:hypothetical protein